jgi:regulator of CtrA degradation
MAKMMSFGEPPRNTVSFAQRLASSGNFKGLFKEGMALVEEAAAYLDGPGRTDAKTLARLDALAYASESMRLTTRLMQLASWLLLQRAVNEGELSPTQAISDKHKVKLSYQELAAPSEQFARLPEPLRELCERSLRLQSRIIHLDKLLYAKAEPATVPRMPFGIQAQFEQLRQAFAPQLA